MNHEEAKAHLIGKVREQVKRLESSIPDLINHLDRSGSGIVDDHIESLSKGRIYETANRVQLAVLEHFVESSRPPRSLNTREFRAYVRNLINLL
jgi:hypothetical protein